MPQPTRAAVDSCGMPSLPDISAIDPFQAQALRERYAAAVARVWLVIAVATLVFLVAVSHAVVSHGGRVDDDFGVHLAATGFAFVTAIGAALARVRGRWPAMLIAIALAPMTYRVWLALGRTHRLFASMLDIVTLLALAVAVVGTLFALVGQRPQPPWREPTLPRATAR
jgi:hypothetical protein